MGHTTTTDPRSQRNRVGRRGGQLTNTSSQLIVQIGLPTSRAPGAPCPGWSHHTPRSDRSQSDNVGTEILIPVTNAIESLHRGLRKIIKTRGAFPNDEAAMKTALPRA